MPIIVNVDVMLAKRKMKSKDLADAIGITVANLSILKTGSSGQWAVCSGQWAVGSLQWAVGSLQSLLCMPKIG